MLYVVVCGLPPHSCMVLEESTREFDTVLFRDWEELAVSFHLENPGSQGFVPISGIGGGSFWFQVDHMLGSSRGRCSRASKASIITFLGESEDFCSELIHFFLGISHG